MKYSQKIAVLGGSFNPPHKGHLYISLNLLKLGFDEVWWIVSPINPHKKKLTYITAPYNIRVDAAKKITQNYSKIKILTIEKDNNLKYSYQTLSLLQEKYKKKFYWVIGMDNFIKFHLWHKYKEILKKVSLLIIPRNNSNYYSFNKKAQNILKNSNLKTNILYKCLKNDNHILQSEKLSWIYFDIKKINISSTKLRKKNNSDWWKM